jgi:hypothetical protein
VCTESRATTHLADLVPLLGNKPANKSPRFPMFLPDNFFAVLVFFELRTKDHKPKLLDTVFPSHPIPPTETIVLRREGRSDDASGRIYPGGSADDPARRGAVAWSENEFALFAFDLLAPLKGTYRPNLISSAHALGSRLVKL